MILPRGGCTFNQIPASGPFPVRILFRAKMLLCAVLLLPRSCSELELGVSLATELRLLRVFDFIGVL